MERIEGGLAFYYHYHHGQTHHHQQHHAKSSSSNNNGVFSPSSSSAEGDQLVFFPNSVSGRASAAPALVPPSEPARRKRGRPRKYAPSPSLSSSSTTTISKASALISPTPSRKKETSKKSKLAALGNAGQGFTPHVITIAAGEDVAQKVMSFVQQCNHSVCILSASGTISYSSLCQPAMLGGNVTYEGRFEILSLSGSFLHTETGGASSRTGGLSVCLSGADGRIVGGGVGGPLMAAGPVQVIVFSFLFDIDHVLGVPLKLDTSSCKLSPPILSGATIVSLSPVSFRPAADSMGADDHPNIGGSGSSFMLKSRVMHVMPSRPSTDWRGGNVLSDLEAT